MLGLETDSDDDPNFVGLVDRLIAGSLIVHSQDDARVFKIDNWFDHKWLGFSGKVLAAIGVWHRPTTVPPFVANRLVRRSHFRRGEQGEFSLVGHGPDIHHKGWSSENLRRRVRRVVPNSALFWYSGNTLATGRGSLMGYIPVGTGLWTWFLGLTLDGEWKVARRKNIHDYEVRSYVDASEGVRNHQI